MFFIDKYVPKKIDESHFHKELLKILKIMSEDESIPHLIFHGPEGSGKKTIIKLLLQLLYDDDINNTTINDYVVIGSGNKANTIPIKQSNYHLIIEPNNTNFDKHLVQDVIKEHARKKPLNVFKSRKSFKVVLINGIDNMSYYAQTSLRRTMEKYSKTCRFIMCCHSLSKVIDPLKSRCLCFSVPSPKDSTIFTYLFKVSIYENIKLGLFELLELSARTNGNIKKGLWLLQLIKAGYDSKTDYDDSIELIVDIIFEHELSRINELRNILYNIMITNIDGSKMIYDILMKILERKIGEKTKCNIIDLASRYDHNIVRGRREIIHLEAFIVSTMKEIINNK